MRFYQMRILAILMMAVLVGFAVATACTQTPSPSSAPAQTSTPVPTAKPTSTPTASPTPTPTSAPTYAAPIILKGQTSYAQGHPNSVTYDWWAKEVEKRTGGRLKINYQYATPYGSHQDLFDLINGGVVDFGHIYGGYTPGRLELINIFAFPFDWKSAEELAYVAGKVSEKGYFDKELAAGGVTYVGSFVGPAYSLYTVKSVKGPADVKGMKIRTGGGVMARWMEAEGGIDITISSPEQYLALQKGTIDGTAMPPPSALSLKLYEITKYVNALGLAGFHAPLVINTKVFNKLPADIQGILKQLAPEVGPTMAKALDVEAAHKGFTDKGAQVYYPTAAEMADWTKPIPALLNGELTKLKSKGYPMDQFMQDFNQYRTEFRSKK